MGDDLAEYMSYLKTNVSELKQLGKEWGMSDNDIRECIEEVLRKAKKKDFSNSWKNMGRRMWSYIRFLITIPLYLALAVILLTAGIALLTTYSDTSEQYINRILQPHGYTIFRYLRLATLPIHSLVNISEYYTAECIIPNPMFRDDAPDCYPCTQFKSVKRFNTSEFAPGKLYSYMDIMRPVMFKDSLSADITYKDLRKLYTEHSEVLQSGLQRFRSKEPTLINSLYALFNEDKEEAILGSNTLQIVWTSKIQEKDPLDKLFPRPAFLPKGFELDDEKHIFIDAPKTRNYQLPWLDSVLQVYTQVMGQRSILIQPVERCSVRCNTLMVTLEPGTSVAFNHEIWAVQVLANGDEMGIGYHSAFYMK